MAPGAWLAASGLEARYEIVDGHRLRYVRAGSGPAVVLVHGFASSLYTWKDVIPALAAGHDVVALDLPGFGQSDQPADLSFEDFPRAVLGLMDLLGIGKATLVGNSMGGATAAVVAAERPERVQALVLIDAAGFNLGPSERPRMVSFAMSRAGSLLACLPGKRLVVEASLRQVFHDAAHVTPERISEYLAAARRPGTVPAIFSLGASSAGRPAIVAQSLPRIRRGRSSCGATTTAGSRSPTPTGSWPPFPARGRPSSRAAATCRRRKAERGRAAAGRLPWRSPGSGTSAR